MKATRILLVIAVILSGGCMRNQTADFTVKQGPFRQTVTETGELEAIYANALLMPAINYQYGYEFKIVGMADHGKMVKAGDTVIRIDPSSIEKFIITKKEALENEHAAEKKQKVQIENNLQDLRAQLRNEQAAWDLKKLEMERFKFETPAKRKVKELEFRQSTLRLEKIKKKLERRNQLDEYDFRVQKIKVIQGEAELEGAKQVLNQLVLVAPEDGLFQVGTNDYEYPPKSLKVGDRVWPGSLIAKIPDIFHMKVRTFVNESDFTKIGMGMKVLVRLDALPDVPFHGKITEISRVCLPRQKEKVFKVVVVIEESDLRLKPGMTVSCEYLCLEMENARFVPNSCLLREGDRTYVYLKKGANPRKTEVKAGPSNTYHTIIYDQIEAGQPLIPFDEVLNPKKQ